MSNPQASSGPAGDPRISAEERTQVLHWLADSRRQFYTQLDGLSEEQWNWKPGPQRWSVGEIAEHIVLAEALLFTSVQRAISSPPNPDWEQQTKGKTELLLRVVPSREGKAEAPGRIVPREGMACGPVLERFEQQRTEIVRLARETQVALKEHTLGHPFPIFGLLHAYQWLLFLPLHTVRHALQIAEIKADACWPAAGTGAP